VLCHYWRPIRLLFQLTLTAVTFPLESCGESAEGGTRTLTGFPTRPSNVRVYQFRHFRMCSAKLQSYAQTLPAMPVAAALLARSLYICTVGLGQREREGCPMHKGAIVLWLGIACWGCASATPSQQRWTVTIEPKHATRFPDEFAELDDEPSAPAQDTLLQRSLEQARSSYLQALHYIERGDTARAVLAFERALNILQPVAELPTASRSEEFLDLLQSVIEDYQSYVRSEDRGDPGSSFFLMRQRLLEMVERSYAQHRVQPLELPTTARELPRTIVPLVLNEYVERALEFLTTRGYRFMRAWLERSTRYFPMMRRIARQEQMPEELIYLSMIESGLNPFAVSWAGAVGLWQFIRSTGELYGLRVTPWIDERRDPEKSTRAAMRHLRDLYTQFGDWHLALAAYNCGAQAVQRALLQARRADSTATRLGYWEIRELLPRETRNYVPLYIATTLIALNPDRYGFPTNQLAYHPEYTYELYELAEPINLSALARCIGISTDSLRQLNPELLTLSTPPDIRPYPLKIPPGTTSQLAQCLLTLSEEEKQPWLVHTVRRHESLGDIAARYGVSLQELRRLNRLPNGRVRAGQRLRIPVTPEALAALSENPPSAAPSATPVANSVSSGASTVRYHRVRRGETLFEIATRYGVSVAELKAWNGLSGDHLRAGQRLRIYQGSAPKPSVLFHTVRRGESATAIAQRYGVTVQQLRQWNPHSFRNKQLLAGTTLRIYRTSTTQAPSAKSKVYIVQAGDTLFSIAQRFGVSVEELRARNGLEGDRIQVGQRLQIP
jgi:membrane-bound lytic murein transglycosylase D